MSHDEAPIGKLRADTLILVSGAIPLTDTGGVGGRLKMSGAKLYIDNSAGWELVTSAAV